MRFFKYMNLFFLWTITILCLSFIYDNWDQVSLKYFGPSAISDLDFNQSENKVDKTIRLVTKDEEITTQVFE
jgi:hypothetical protein